MDLFSNNNQLFVDMDGVLSYFVGAYRNITGIDIEGQYITDTEFWEPINQAGEEFWSEMPMTPYGYDLWLGIKKYNPIILTKPSRNPECITGKIKWIKKYLGNNVPYIMTFNSKSFYATPKSILIDDYSLNLEEWNNAGGIAVYYNGIVSPNFTLNTIRLLYA